MRTNDFDDVDPNGIESWSHDRDFDRLTPEERARVLASLGSREAYDRLRARLAAMREGMVEAEARMAPDAAIRSDLHAAMARRHAHAPRPASLLSRVLSWRLPAYQAAIGAAAFAGLALLLIPRELTHTPGAGPSDAPRIVERIVRVPVHDTLMARADEEATIRRITDSVREEMRTMMARERRRAAREGELARRAAPDRTKEPSARETPADAPSGAPQIVAGPNRFVGLANLSQLDVQRRGKSLREDSAYGQFGVTLRKAAEN